MKRNASIFNTVLNCDNVIIHMRKLTYHNEQHSIDMIVFKLLYINAKYICSVLENSVFYNIEKLENYLNKAKILWIPFVR